MTVPVAEANLISSCTAAPLGSAGVMDAGCFTAPVAPGILERILSIDCQGQTLWGVLSLPGQDMARSGCGVVIVVGGPQYRVGSHRQFVQLARALSGAGHVALRFDCRGMGDSLGATPDFRDIDADILAAVLALKQACPWIQRTVLWGLCDGASAALLLLQRQPASPIHGLCLVNPWVRSAQTLAATQIKHYYGQRLLQRDFWRKLLRGGVSLRSLGELVRSAQHMFVRQAHSAVEQSFQHGMAKAWRDWSGPMLLVLSGNDYTAREFLEAIAADPVWSGALARPNLQRIDLPEADHTLSRAEHRTLVEAATLDWLGQSTVGAFE